jgi:hypothetical protein
MSKLLPALLASLSVNMMAAAASDAADLYPWRNHAAPFEFLFGNDIDTHQQTRRMRDGSLYGFFYVRHTGVVTKDGQAVATHADCSAVTDCTVGWALAGKPTNAALLYEVMHDHPVFLVSRQDIPQPGGYTHFHWLGAAMPAQRATAAGYLLQLTAADSFCFIHHEAEMARSNKTCRENGGIGVTLGSDNATHLNIVTGAPPGM